MIDEIEVGTKLNMINEIETAIIAYKKQKQKKNKDKIRAYQREYRKKSSSKVAANNKDKLKN